MGYSASAYVVFGVKANKRDLVHVKEVRGCHHEIDPAANFCSVCGKPRLVQEKVYILDERNGDVYHYVSDPNHSEVGVLGIKLNDLDQYSREGFELIKEPTEKMTKEIMNFSKKYGLNISEKDLKKYVMIYHSY